MLRGSRSGATVEQEDHGGEKDQRGSDQRENADVERTRGVLAESGSGRVAESAALREDTFGRSKKSDNQCDNGLHTHLNPPHHSSSVRAHLQQAESLREKENKHHADTENRRRDEPEH